MPRYTTWQQVAGYFDGNGTIGISDLSNIPFKLSLSLVFVDQSFEQIEMIRAFLQDEGIRTSSVLNHYKQAAHLIAISGNVSVVRALRMMYPFLFKKANEAKVAIDYLEDRVTGNRLLDVFQQEVEAGRRERRPHRVKVDVPYTRVDGLALMSEKRKATFTDVFGRFRSKGDGG